MNKLQLSAVLALASSAVCGAPVIPADSISLTVDAHRIVRIGYTLKGEDAVVTFDVETKDARGEWKSLGLPLAHSVGDCWRKVSPGPHQIVWSARRDWPDRYVTDSSIRAVVTAWATNNPPTYMVLDLDAFSQAFYPSTNHFPLGLQNEMYRTTKLVMRRIPAAGSTFMMGQSTNNATDVSCRNCFAPQDARNRLVAFSNDFYMAIYETTQRQHQKLRGDGKNDSSQEFAADKPVNAVSYVTLRGKAADGIDWPTTGSKVSDASALKRFRDNSGIAFDLPTEAEWEFACRAGTDTAFYNGEEFSSSETGCPHLGDLAWYKANRPSVDRIVTAGSAVYGGLQVVGQKRPNAWGLYDMYGNASEWCKDWAGTYDTAVQPVVSPVGPVSGTKRIKRGGNWFEEGVWCSSSGRSSTANIDYSLDPSGGTGDKGTYYCWSNGFRLVCPAVAK